MARGGRGAPHLAARGEVPVLVVKLPRPGITHIPGLWRVDLVLYCRSVAVPLLGSVRSSLSLSNRFRLHGIELSNAASKCRFFRSNNFCILSEGYTETFDAISNTFIEQIVWRFGIR